jgi:predicted nucleotide-binding protein
MDVPSRIFISYARPDANIAQALAEKLKQYGLDPWIDYDQLGLGVDWVQEINKGLRSADGIVIIASERSERSEWVFRELRLGIAQKVPILPIVVEDYKYLPIELRHIQAALVTLTSFDASMDAAARAVRAWVDAKPKTKVREDFASKLAEDLAEEATKAGQTVAEEASRSVFVVHGHDEAALREVTAYLKEIEVNPIVLKDIEEQEDSLLRRFLRVAEQATFAVVVYSPDDTGASLVHYAAPKGGEKALRYRARQNVILELGFFLGKLKDFSRVFVLKSHPKEEWPEFELPSDLAGAIFKELDGQGRWKGLLRAALVKAGIQVK